MNRVRLEIAGIVQGVGFRPFVHRLARECGVTGWARNTRAGVEVELEGEPGALGRFEQMLKASPPPLARLESVRAERLEGLVGYEAFSIRPSDAGDGATLAAPDTALCPDCLRELKTPTDRRYRYPFINCTNCGPRFTILKDLPYDRAQTAMSDFPMCPDCGGEYGEIDSRRYHAQPNCCSACGPQVFFLSEKGVRQTEDPFASAQRALAEGKILAVKGIGGIHLACDARNAAAVQRLRRRKGRAEKPLAVLCRDLSAAKRLCGVTEEERALLLSASRPIVLLEKHRAADWPALSQNNRLGVMLPYTPLHVLLLDGAFRGPEAVVMTSANLPGCPVMIDNEEALEGLGGIADGFLLHNRPILHRCDDSLVMAWRGEPYFLRRSRGWVPQPVTLSGDVTGVVAFGAEQKASFAVGRGCYAFPSQHIGDLKSAETLRHYRGAMDTYLRLFRVEPTLLVCDLHPDYASTREARGWGRNTPVLPVQHHWAHMAACMADNGLQGPAFGIIWDGTGLGTDDTIWGGEFLVGDFASVTRVGSIRPIRLPGGDAAVWEIGRIGLSLLRDAALPTDAAPVPAEKRAALEAMLANNIACPPASSVGRLFDGVYALLSGESRVSYEGQGAVLLESWVRPDTPARRYPLAWEYRDTLRCFDMRPLIRAIWADWEAGIPKASIARGFMDALCHMAVHQCQACNAAHLPVVLSGGVFLNRYLLNALTRLLEEAGFSSYTHHHVSSGDEGLCLGQIAIGGMRRKEYVPCNSPEGPLG
ncbi:MAG: carbamoyltransferase HypF [Oscillibacter sp.]